MLNKEDINKYNTTQTGRSMSRTDGEMARSAGATTKTVGGMIWRFFKTILLIGIISGCLVMFSVASVIWSFRDSEVAVSLSTFKMSESSMIYVADQLHIDSVDTAKWTEHQKLYDTQIRTRVDFTQIPQIMKDAMVAIEDKRFYEHHGVDWWTTGGAVLNLASGGSGGGGSTITQQLIKNLTGENDVSILRKVKEIFMALNLEKKYTKPQILEAYLNLVDYGNGYYGVQAAAKGYFGKDIWDCNIAECATIAATTQNPSALNVFYYPMNNAERRNTIIDEMYKQEMITKAEYEQAKKDSANLKLRGIDFGPEVGQDEEDEDDENEDKGNVWNWYDEEVFEDAITLLMEYGNLDYNNAEKTIYNGGLKIYSAQYVPLQEGFERLLQNNWQDYTDDDGLWSGACLMEYDGRILAVNSNSATDENELIEKVGNRVGNNVSINVNQPGSAIKPIGVYAPALEENLITYGTAVKDEPLPNYFPDGSAGPYNFDSSFSGVTTVERALEESLNAPAAQIINQMSPLVSFNFLTQRLHVTSLTEEDSVNIGGVSIGGLTHGISVRQMVGAYQIFGNGGKYYDPYTVYRIEDHEGNVLYDYQQRVAEQAISFDNATIMNKLLHRPVEGSWGTALAVQRSDLDIIAKTGTTELYNDIWFMGGTPSFMTGIWYGHETKQRIWNTNGAKDMYNGIINWMAENYSDFLYSGSYAISDNVVPLSFCRDSGFRPGSYCQNIGSGWYSNSNIPKTCNGGSDHLTGKRYNTPTPVPSASPSVSASPSPTPEVTPSPTPEVTPSPTPEVTPEPPVVTPTPTPTPTPEPPVVTPEPPVVTPEPPVVTPEPPPVVEPPPAA